MIPTNDPNIVILSEDENLSDCLPLGVLELYDDFSIIGEAVLHKRFGKGTIVSINSYDNYSTITVNFGERNSKFIYPDAFERFLKYENEDYQRRIESYLERYRRIRENKRRCGGLLYDKVEDSAYYMSIQDELEKLIEDRIGKGGYLGFCHMYWMTKEEILKEKYGIEWKSPAELNPDIKFD